MHFQTGRKPTFSDRCPQSTPETTFFMTTWDINLTNSNSSLSNSFLSEISATILSNFSSPGILTPSLLTSFNFVPQSGQKRASGGKSVR
jgi:hypothetical protein